MSNEHIADVPPGYVPFHVMDYLDTDESIWLYFAELAEPENKRIFAVAVMEVLLHREEKFGVLSSNVPQLQKVFDVVNGGKVLTQEVVKNICNAS